MIVSLRVSRTTPGLDNGVLSKAESKPEFPKDVQSLISPHLSLLHFFQLFVKNMQS
ncbi:MAG: hypothetical protein WCR78_13355 [Arcobacteraceae bacterium]